MDPSANFDRERRRTKAGKRKTWATSLMRPATLRIVIAVGVQVARVAWMVYRMIHFWRE